MAQKQYGLIPKDTSQTGYAQDKPIPGIRHAEDRHESFVQGMVHKIMNWRKKKKKKEGMGSVTTDAMESIQKRKKALEEASK